MKYECIESKRDQGWAVEAINHEGEGEISRVLFTGYKAEALAREYASWRNEANRPLAAAPNLKAVDTGRG